MPKQKRKQNNVHINPTVDRHTNRVERGNMMLVDDAKKSYQQGNDWNLDWFEPKGRQAHIIESIDYCTFTVIDGPSGSGKTSCALYKALSDMKDHQYRQLVFIKNPTEVGDDQIGFLSGSEQDKLVAHYETTKRIFYNFISKGKLDSDIRAERIRLTIPNFLLGATLDDAIIILDESQLMSPATVKLLLERIGKNSKYIILGDSYQRYAVKKRSDGFSDLISRVTYDNHGTLFAKYEDFSYIKLTRDENMRSDGSKLINYIYGTGVK
jgi:predicted ribonuclease YlaK